MGSPIRVSCSTKARFLSTSTLTSFTRPAAAVTTRSSTGGECFARSAPGGPEIDQHGRGAGGLDDLFDERSLIGIHDAGLGRGTCGLGLLPDDHIHS